MRFEGKKSDLKTSIVGYTRVYILGGVVCSGTAFSPWKSWWFTRPSNTVIVDRNAVDVSNIIGKKKHYVTCRVEKTFGLRACDWCCTYILYYYYFLSLTLSFFLVQITWFTEFGQRSANASSCCTRPTPPKANISPDQRGVKSTLLLGPNIYYLTRPS